MKQKNLWVKKKIKENNPMFGKKHKEKSKMLMRQKALGRIFSEET